MLVLSGIVDVSVMSVYNIVKRHDKNVGNVSI